MPSLKRAILPWETWNFWEGRRPKDNPDYAGGIDNEKGRDNI